MKNDALSRIASTIFLTFLTGVTLAVVTTKFHTPHCINIVSCLAVNHTAVSDMALAGHPHRDRDDSAQPRETRSLVVAAPGHSALRIHRTRSKPLVRLILRMPWESPPTSGTSTPRPVGRPMS